MVVRASSGSPPHDPDEIMGDPAIQAIAIRMPIPLLSMFADAALRAGKHAFAEKPLAQSSETADLLADLARQRGLVLSAGYVFLYHPVYIELKRRVKLQSIRSIKLEWRKFGTFAEPIEQSLLTHHLSLMLDLLGVPKSGRIDHGPGVYTKCDKIETHLEYPTLNVISSIDRSTSLPSAHRMTLEMDDGRSLEWEVISSRRLMTRMPNRWSCTTTSIRRSLLRLPDLSTLAAGGKSGTPRAAGPFAAKVFRLLEKLRDFK